MIGEPGKIQTTENPVVDGVLWQVAPGHGWHGEFVDEKGLEFAFDKVEKDECEQQTLGRRGRHRGDGEGEVRVEICAESGQEKERVDQERPDIFDDKDSTPADLQA